METWKDAGIPLEAVLRGIDITFDKWERRPRKTRKVNGLGFCAQEVLASAEETEGCGRRRCTAEKKRRYRARSIGGGRVSVAQRRCNSTRLRLPGSAQSLARETAATLRSLAESLSQASTGRTWKIWSGD